jgi:hypothetical protein
VIRNGWQNDAPMGRLLSIDTARCVADTVDGETLVIDTVSGHLRVLTGTAPTVWDRLLQPCDAEQLVAEVADRFGHEAGEQVLALLDQLVDDQVVLADAPAGDATPQGLGWPDTWAAPGVERYDDIAEIMAMDPVHEVDATKGWPRTDTPPA